MNIPRWKYSQTILRRGMFFFLLCIITGTALGQEFQHAISISGGWMEDSRIFISPQSPDPVSRQSSTDVGGNIAWSASYRMHITPTVLLQLHGEYVHAHLSEADQVGTIIENGYDVELVECSGVFTLPFSSERFSMFIGGGIGAYFGHRVYSIAGVSAETVSSTPAFGIHVLVGAEYLLTRQLGVRADIRFRDPQMSVENRFPQSSVLSNGVEYPLESAPFLSYINLNGNVYSLGLSWHF